MTGGICHEQPVRVTLWLSQVHDQVEEVDGDPGEEVDQTHSGQHEVGALPSCQLPHLTLA